MSSQIVGRELHISDGQFLWSYSIGQRLSLGFKVRGYDKAYLGGVWVAKLQGGHFLAYAKGSNRHSGGKLDLIDYARFFQHYPDRGIEFWHSYGANLGYWRLECKRFRNAKVTVPSCARTSQNQLMMNMASFIKIEGQKRGYLRQVGVTALYVLIRGPESDTCYIGDHSQVTGFAQEF